LRVRPENVEWSSLSGNHAAIRILENNIDKIVWSVFSSNSNAGELLKTQVEIEAKKLYKNTSTYNMLNWFGISKNPSIFTY